MENEEDKKKKLEMGTEQTGWQSFWELVKFALVALVIVVPIRLFVAEPFVVSGSSMFPTFKDKDYLIVDKLSYELGTPERDDVVIFKYPNDTTKYFIKRIIGLPDETVDIKGNTITITNAAHPNGFTLDQPFVKELMPDNTQTIHTVLKDNEYFVMGDNRPASSDSRYWGTVNRNLLTGRAFLRLLPLNGISAMPGNYKQAN
jgi:signal peptidase I